jgi:predicted GH43/DUF377 family glycosyl hydrolase
MKWERLGRVFCPSGQYAWMQTHAAIPVPLHLSGDLFRVYFGTRDGQNHTHIGYVEFDIKRPNNILHISSEHVLGPGPRGYFDDSGVYPGQIVEREQKLFMYFLGRNNGVPPLYYMCIGLAVSEDHGKTFRRLFKSPLMGRSESDPWMVASPFVRNEGDRWRMWYLSGFKWDETGENPHSYYHIKYAESTDGIHWQRDGLVCIDLRRGETNIACPTVLKEGGTYKMWYSYVAGQGYRIGYAESSDGYAWTRKDDEVGIDVSPSGWDSQDMAYPYVFKYAGKKYMLYSGNSFGKEGFGLAVSS